MSQVWVFNREYLYWFQPLFCENQQLMIFILQQHVRTIIKSNSIVSRKKKKIILCTFFLTSKRWHHNSDFIFKLSFEQVLTCVNVLLCAVACMFVHACTCVSYSFVRWMLAFVCLLDRVCIFVLMHVQVGIRA